MRRRDRQNEVVVTVIVVSVMALALAFGVVLTLGNREMDASATPTAQSTSDAPVLVGNPTAIAQDVTLTATLIDDNIEPAATVTSSPAPSDTTVPMDDIEPSNTPSNEPAGNDTPKATATEIDTTTPEPSTTNTSTKTPTKTATPSDTPSNTPTDTATDTATDTPTNTHTPTFTNTPTSTDTPTRTATPTRTPTFTRTFTPSITSTFTPVITHTFTAVAILPSYTPSSTPSVVPCEPHPDWDLYIVAPGDSLYELSVATGASMAELVLANCLISLELQAGQQITVPPGTIGNPVGIGSRTECPHPQIQIFYPPPGSTLQSGFEMVGLADNGDFGFYRLEVRHAGGAPTYHTVYESSNRVSSERGLGIVNFQSNYISGEYWIRVVVFDANANQVDECAILVNFAVN